MTDIVERLMEAAQDRAQRAWDTCQQPDCMMSANLATEAAAEIECLRSELSTAHAAGRREGIEEAAKVAQAVTDRREANIIGQEWRIYNEWLARGSRETLSAILALKDEADETTASQ